MPSTGTVCPKCYGSVPRNTVSREPPRRTPVRGEKEKNKTLAFVLAVLPGIFGFQGLGLIYLNHENRRGWHFLAVGLVLFLSLLGCVSWWDGVGSITRVLLVFAMIILSIIYISSYLAQLAETKFGTVFGLFRL
jgi:hypothetical protein